MIAFIRKDNMCSVTQIMFKSVTQWTIAHQAPSVLGIIPGRNTGVDYHFLPQSDSMWGFVYSNFPRIRTPKLNDFKGKLERRQCGNRNRVSGRMWQYCLGFEDEGFHGQVIRWSLKSGKSKETDFVFLELLEETNPVTLILAWWD